MSFPAYRAVQLIVNILRRSPPPQALCLVF